MPDYVAFHTRALFDLGWRRGYIREDQSLPRTLQVSHLFPVELTYAKIGNSLLLKRYFREIAGVCIVFRTLGTQAKKQFSREIILVETSHVPYIPIF